ncbi:MAG: hypothetical protein JWL83_3109 [Actinomycetia bacterium]|nr:hypothetical protein [Actinomycetes bacterium]
MPTDPFVSPDPDDRPRQQQNLAPGVAYPPARGWHATRPGDNVSSQPSGPMRGAPGPNIGYAYTLTNRVKDRFRLAPHEYIGDAVAVVAEIAARRAALYGRAPVIRDVEFAANILGYDANGDFAPVRALLLQEAAHDYTRRRAIVDSVPEDLLRAASNDVRERIAQWRANAARLVAAETAI